jgi:hypothetical protein
MSGKTFEAVTGAAVKSTVTAMATLKVNLAVQHMLAAASFSRLVGKLEREYTGQPFGEFWEGILHNAVACVFTAIASLEAYANEVFSDRATIFSAFSPELLDNLWETYEQKPILEKFEFALLLLRKQKLDRGVSQFQDVKVLIDLRNALTHFKPEWENEADEHKKISDKLTGKFNGGPFLSTEPSAFSPTMGKSWLHRVGGS